ncbi:unnamed protein product [Peniophora sp. CBMAI 1063]|nr:unnamed protein product [Peniophora sp. CBMAI 1063]
MPYKCTQEWAPERCPDYLSVIAGAFDSFNKQEKQISKDADATFKAAKPLVQHQARVLDSLAHLLVSEPEGQRIVIGAEKGAAEPAFKLLVAEEPMPPEDSPMTTTAAHLRVLLLRLWMIRSLWVDRKGPPANPDMTYASHPDDPFESAVVELEIIVLRYSWPNLAHRILAGSQNTHFMDTAADVCGTPALKREDISNEERELLASLQELPLSNGALGVQTQLDNIKMLSRFAKEDATPSDADLRKVRFALVIANLWRIRLSKSGKQQAWDDYARSRLSRTGLTSAPDNRNIDVARWIDELTVIRFHFRRVSGITISPHLSPLLYLVEGIVCIDADPPAPKSFEVDRARLVRVLYAAGIDAHELNDVRINDFLESLRVAHGGTWSDGEDGDARHRKFVIEPIRTLHPECLILNELHERAAIPFVGTSEPACAFCETYFALYRSFRGWDSPIHLMSSHNRTSGWVFPAFSDRLTRQLEQAFCGQMIGRIRHGWHRYSPNALRTDVAWSSLDCDPDLLQEWLTARQEIEESSTT